MVKIPFKTGAGLIPENTYPVVFAGGTEKKTAKGADMITLRATIKGSGTDYDGRSLVRNFVFSNDPEKDNSATIFYLQKALLAFGADNEDVTEDGVDVVKEVTPGLVGNPAQATVTHNQDANDAEKVYLNVEFMETGF